MIGHMARENVSVLELCLSRAIPLHGMIRGATSAGRTAVFIAEWATYEAERPEEDHTIAAFGRWANVPPRTMARRIAEFRELFPEHAHETPSVFVQYMRSVVPESFRSPSPTAA